MLTSLALIFLIGMLSGWIFKKIHLPPLLGMILTGIILSPYAANLIDGSIMGISPQLRQIALVIILTRAGLSLDVDDLKKAGRPAILMCFLPATFEICGTLLITPRLFGITLNEAAILGSVIAAVSPAVVVPRMIKLIDEGYGVGHKIPHIILAGSSADDVYVIVLFTAFVSLASGGAVSALSFVQIPTSIILGVILGAAIGLLLNLFFKNIHIRDSSKVIILLSLSFLMLAVQTLLENIVQISALIGIMAMGLTLYKVYPVLSKRLSEKYSKLWIAAELMLFVLVGATVDLSYALSFGLKAILFVFVAMLFRMTGVFVSLLKTKITLKERLFCMLAYTPKATVQAAIGAVPLAMGLSCGQLVLTVAVLSILITAPLGAFMIDLTYKKLLKKGN